MSGHCEACGNTLCICDEVGMAVVPWTGEALALRDMTMEQIALALIQAREFEFVGLRSFKRELQDEILRRLDERAEWTVHAEGFKLVGDSPNRSEWDVDALLKALESLIDDGLLKPQAADRAIKSETTYKPVAAGINALLKLGGDVAVRLEACRLPSSKPRAVKVSRA